MKNIIENKVEKKNRLLFTTEPKYFLIAIAFSLVACKPAEPPAPYSYNPNPVFTWGYADFFGNYYSHYGIQNNVVSLNLFTEKLVVNTENKLEGTGQYLILEDIFSAKTDTLLPAGSYRIADTGDPFTFYGGKKFDDNRNVIPSGAYIYYIEADASKSKIAYVTDGTFSVSVSTDGIYTIQCDFTLDEKTKMTGTFKSELSHFDRTTLSLSRSQMQKIKFAIEFAD